jgi:hypothetical protein
MWRSMPIRHGLGLTRARKHCWFRHIRTYIRSAPTALKNERTAGSFGSNGWWVTRSRRPAGVR